MIVLVNPNTNTETTAAMLEIARAEADPAIRIAGLTAGRGAPLITDPDQLDSAAEAVLDLVPGLIGAHAVIVAAFGDPGLKALRARVACPVTGIAEAGMLEAARDGRRFAVVTTTPALRDRIAETAALHGHEGFLGTWTTPGDPAVLTADASALRRALRRACEDAVSAGAEAVIIGGGPLAEAARNLAGEVSVPLIEPVPVAVRLTLSRIAEGAP